MSDEQKSEGSEEVEQGTEEVKPHNPDKGLQKLQMKHAATERKLDEMRGMMETLVSRLETGTPAQQQKAEDKIDDLLNGLDDDSTVDVATMRKMMDRIMSGSKNKELEAKIDATLNLIQSQQSENQTKAFWDNWASQHPTVADQKDTFLDDAELEVSSEYPHLRGNERLTAIKLTFDRLVKDAEKAGSKKDESKAAPSKKPPKSTAGTDFVPSGSTDKGTKESKDRLPGPIWVPDA